VPLAERVRSSLKLLNKSVAMANQVTHLAVEQKHETANLLANTQGMQMETDALSLQLHKRLDISPGIATPPSKGKGEKTVW